MKNENGKKTKAAGLIVDRALAQETSLNVLKRFDNDVEEVLAIATHVSLYQMAVTTRQWARKNVEGSLFLVKRRGQPRFQLTVLNKLSTDIFTDPVDGRFEFELNNPYLMYTKGNEEIIGIWFYEEEDIAPFSALLSKVCSTLPKPDPSTQPAASTSPQTVAPAPAPAPQPAATSGAAGPAPNTTTAPAASSTASADHMALMNWIHRLEQPARSSTAAPAADDGSYQANSTEDVAAIQPVLEQVQDPPERSSNLTALLLQAQKRHQETQAAPAAPQSTSQQAPNGPPPQPNGLLHAPNNGIPPFPDPSVGQELLAPTFFSQPQVVSPATGLSELATSTQTLPQAPLASDIARADKPNKLLELLTRGRDVSTKSAVPLPPSVPVLEAPPAMTAAQTRDKLRIAINRLLQNDTVMDLLADQLREVGLL